MAIDLKRLKSPEHLRAALALGAGADMPNNLAARVGPINAGMMRLGGSAPAASPSPWTTGPGFARIIVPRMRLEACDPNRRHGATRAGVPLSAFGKRAERRRVADVMWRYVPTLQAPLVVTLTRIAPRMVSDDDNLKARFKAVRDEIAKQLGIDDGRRDLVSYETEQRRGAAGEYAIEIEIRERR